MIAPNELRRSGVTLIEVLVAIFVASIGLLALLALFPVGALSMRQALKDSRCAQCSINGFALFKSMKIGQDSALTSLTTDPFADGFALPNIYGQRPAALPNGPSYPVYIDPLGASIKSFNPLGTYNHLPLPTAIDIATNPYPRILRGGRELPAQWTFQIMNRWFSVLDDINFDPLNPANPGQPCIALRGNFTRDPRYTFAYMVRRPYSGNPTCFDVTIVVYAGRAINTTMGSTEEQAFNQVSFTQGSTMVKVPFSGTQPAIKPGGWILDASMYDSNNGDNVSPQGYFYRVVDVINNGDSTLTLEFQTPARQSSNSANVAHQGMLIVLDNVAEVFEKRSISLQ